MLVYVSFTSPNSTRSPSKFAATRSLFFSLSSKRIQNKAIYRFVSYTSKMGKGKQFLDGKSSQLYEPCVIVHGGAWSIPEHLQPICLEGVKEAVRAGYGKLLQGGSAVDGVEAAVMSLEDNPVFNAGHGSVLTEDRTVEMDAMVMDGKTLHSGAVACIPNVSNPVAVARLVMDKTSHCLLVGNGAVKFAKKNNVPILDDPTVLISEFSKLKSELVKDEMQNFDSMLAATMNTESLVGDQQKKVEIIKARLNQQNMHDTVGAVAMDCHGNIASATSTGGIPFKMLGRVGDSPMVGSGGYANSSAGVSTTGHGESILKVVLAREIVSHVERGATPTQACLDGLQMMYDKTEGQGGVICIDNNGNFGHSHTTETMSWATLKEGVLSYGCMPGEVMKIQEF